VSEGPARRVWQSEPFAAPFLSLPGAIGVLILVIAAKPEKAIVAALEIVVPFVMGAPWVYRARTPTDAVARGALVGAFAGAVFLVSTYFALRSVQHDDVAPLAMYALVPLMLVFAPAFGIACTCLALAVRWLIRDGRQTPF